MAATQVSSGVYPVFNNEFKIGADTSTAHTIADCESFSVSIDNGIEEWTPMTTEGWIRRLMTAKSISLQVTGKRNIGDAGNDFVAGKFMATGQDAEVYFEWEFPNGAKLTFADAVLNVTALGAGDSTAVAPLEFEIMSNGKPTYTAPASNGNG